MNRYEYQRISENEFSPGLVLEWLQEYDADQKNWMYPRYILDRSKYTFHRITDRLFKAGLLIFHGFEDLSGHFIPGSSFLK